MKYTIYASLLLFSIFAKAGSMDGSLARDGYYAFYTGFSVDFEEKTFPNRGIDLIYGGKISKKNDIGSISAGLKILKGVFLSVEYEYDVLHKMNNWAFGIDASLSFGSADSNKKEDDKAEEPALNLGNSIGFFVEKPVASLVAIVLKAGMMHTSPLKDFGIKKENTFPYIKLGSKLYLDRALKESL